MSRRAHACTAAIGVLALSGCVAQPEPGTWGSAESGTEVTLNTDGSATFTDFPVWPVGDCDAEPTYVSGAGTWLASEDTVSIAPASQLQEGVPVSQEFLVLLAAGGFVRPWQEVAITPPCEMGAEFMVLTASD